MLRSRLARLVALAATVVLALMALAPAAMAADGVGLWGRTTDKDITFWAFGVMALFTILVVVLSIVQGRLDSRKERAREEIERLRR